LKLDSIIAESMNKAGGLVNNLRASVQNTKRD